MTMTANPPIGGQWPSLRLPQSEQNASAPAAGHEHGGLTTALTTSARFVGHFAFALLTVGVLGTDTDY
jgi:hypothetical protein